MEPLVALSVRQPWMDMILRGVKTLEIRTWRVNRRGLIALHAPRTIEFGPAYFYGYKEPWNLPRGKIVAVAEIADVIDLNERLWTEQVLQHRQPLPMADGAYGVFLKNVRRLGQPINYRGQQMFFTLSIDVAERVRRMVDNLV